MNYTISNGKYTATVSDAGAELISLKLDGFELMWQNSGAFWDKHAPLLFPVCGRLKDSKYTLGGKEYNMSTHGFISSSRFELVYRDETKLRLEKRSDAETKKVYPFDFVFTAEYELTGETVKASFTVKNESGEKMPYMFGWHPGFSYSEEVSVLEDLTLDFGKPSLLYHSLQNGCFINPTPKRVEIKDGKYKVDTDYLYKTDTIIFSDTKEKMTLSSDKGNYRFDFSFSKNLPYFCIWKAPDDKARFICLEPWSSLPGDGDSPENFDERAMLRLLPKESESFVYEMKFVK